MNASAVTLAGPETALAALPGKILPRTSSSVADLRCEHLKNPLGLDETCPRFSWKILGDRPGTRQTAYQIEVIPGPTATDTSPRTWDSGKVAGDASVLVEYAGPALLPHTLYAWRVRIWDESQRVTDWSLPSEWETGFLGTPWPADWITLRLGKPGQPDQPCRYLRQTFDLASKPVSARLYITARGLFEPWLNGQRVGQDWLTPGWTDYSTRLEYLAYDVTAHLQPGQNILGAILADGWHCGYLSLRKSRNHYGKEPALLAALRVVETSGRVTWWGTGSKWRGLTGPLRAADLYMGEVYDATRENPDWCRRESAEDYWQTTSLAKFPPVPLAGKAMPAVRSVEEVPAQSVTEVPKGCHVFDLGQNIVGVVRLKVTAPRGTRITLRHAEMLNPNGSLYTENLRTAVSTDMYICKGGDEETYTPRFTFHGFRYVEVKGLPAAPSLDAVTGVVLQSDLPATGTFTCSHDLVNRLQRNIRWSQRGNFLEIPMDCPQRDERLGWTGDAQIFCRTATFNYDVAAFFRKWMTDVRDAQYEDGAYPDVAPDLLRVSNALLKRTPPHPHSGNAAYAEAGVICPWAIYERYGDRRILEENYPAMERWMDYQVRTARDFICPPTSYGDWLATDAVKPAWAPTPCELVGTAYFAHAADIMIRTARALDRDEDVTRYTRLRQKVAEAFQKEFVTPSGRVVGDTQTGYLLAIGFDLIPVPLLRAAGNYLVQTLARRNYHLSTGFVGTPLLCPVLSRIGRTDLAYRLLLNEGYPSWLFPVRNGATTIWERWNSWTPDTGFGDVNMNSFNHYAYGAIGEWLYGNVAGIQSDPAQPGFKHILFRAEPGPGLDSAAAQLESPYGTIESAWTLSDGTWKWSVLVPPNATATLEFPAGAALASTRVNSRPLAGSTLAVPENGGTRTFRLPSGRYLFETTYQSPFPA